jgi:hypothetical protein
VDHPFLTLEEAARVAGHARWLEDRLFAVAGEWVGAEADAAAKAVFSAHSLRHAWHASVWRDRLPRVAHLDADALTVPASSAVAAVVDELAAATTAGADATLERLTLLAQVLEVMIAAYRDRAARAHPLADGPTVRWLAFVMADEVAALDEVRALLGKRSAVPGLPLRELEPGALLGLVSSGDS